MQKKKGNVISALLNIHKIYRYEPLKHPCQSITASKNKLD